MMIKPVSRLSANNAAFNCMNNAAALNGLCSFAGGADSALLLSKEKSLNADMLRNSLIYKTSLLQEESLDKLNKENIKRTFSTFA